MTSRLPVTPEVHQGVKAITGGAVTNFDAVLRWLVAKAGYSIEDRSGLFDLGIEFKEEIRSFAVEKEESE